MEQCWPALTENHCSRSLLDSEQPFPGCFSRTLTCVTCLAPARGLSLPSCLLPTAPSRGMGDRTLCYSQCVPLTLCSHACSTRWSATELLKVVLFHLGREREGEQGNRSKWVEFAHFPSSVFLKTFRLVQPGVQYPTGPAFARTFLCRFFSLMCPDFTVFCKGHHGFQVSAICPNLRVEKSAEFPLQISLPPVVFLANASSSLN